MIVRYSRWGDTTQKQIELKIENSLTFEGIYRATANLVLRSHLLACSYDEVSYSLSQKLLDEQPGIEYLFKWANLCYQRQLLNHHPTDFGSLRSYNLRKSRHYQTDWFFCLAIEGFEGEGIAKEAHPYFAKAAFEMAQKRIADAEKKERPYNDYLKDLEEHCKILQKMGIKNKTIEHLPEVQKLIAKRRDSYIKAIPNGDDPQFEDGDAFASLKKLAAIHYLERAIAIQGKDMDAKAIKREMKALFGCHILSGTITKLFNLSPGTTRSALDRLIDEVEKHVRQQDNRFDTTADVDIGGGVALQEMKKPPMQEKVVVPSRKDSLSDLWSQIPAKDQRGDGDHELTDMSHVRKPSFS